MILSDAGLPQVSGVSTSGATTTAAKTSSAETTLIGEACTPIEAGNTQVVFATTGAVKVGIISGSFNALGGYSKDVAQGLLPSNVIVLKDDLAKTEDDEGRGMAEVVHAVAPGGAALFLNRRGRAGSLRAVHSGPQGCRLPNHR